MVPDAPEGFYRSFRSASTGSSAVARRAGSTVDVSDELGPVLCSHGLAIPIDLGKPPRGGAVIREVQTRRPIVKKDRDDD